MNSFPDLPPPYSREDLHRACQNEYPAQSQFRIIRKPVQPQRPKTAVAKEQYPPPGAVGRSNGHVGVEPEVQALAGLNLNRTPRREWESSRPLLSVDTHIRPRTAESRPSIASAGASVTTGSLNPSPISSMSSLPSSSQASRSPSPASTTPIQKAFQEVRHFAGGLISHPCESTRHYSILRHSHGLVFYQGLNTTLAVSIFAGLPLPSDSTIWLQNKGWTGKTGMRLKALFGADGDWLNVTPTMSIGSEQLKPTDERAWQRDITRFKKKSVGHRRERHVLRTTAIVRIPPEAEDGYFQLVLCLGEKKKILCTSPSFRVLSTSASPHSIRGASLSTMPLEIGAMVLGIYARNTAGRVIGPAVAVAQNQVQKYMPSSVPQTIATSAYNLTIADRVGSAVDDIKNQSSRARGMGCVESGNATVPADVEFDQGPKAPYPVRLISATEPARTEHSNLPCLKLGDISDSHTKNLSGHYFGWARYLMDEKKPQPSDTDDWFQVLISVLLIAPSQLSCASIAEAKKKIVTVLVVQERDDMPLGHSLLEIKMMGFIRPDEPIQRANLTRGLAANDEAAVQAAITLYMNDVVMMQSFLAHPSWGSRSECQSGKLQRPGGLERLKTGLADAAIAAQRGVERVGVRSPVDSSNDTFAALNGFWVRR
jgi:hypothetical protein